jgi:chromatin remodeling complex protein RSC6
MAKKKKTTTKKKVTVKKVTAAKKKPAVKKKAVAKKTSSNRGAGLNKMSYAVSEKLAAIVGNKKLTRPQIVKGLWAYIKAHKCQDTKNKRMINPDDKLAEVLGKKPVDMLKLAGFISKHIVT